MYEIIVTIFMYSMLLRSCYKCNRDVFLLSKWNCLILESMFLINLLPLLASIQMRCFHALLIRWCCSFKRASTEDRLGREGASNEPSYAATFSCYLFTTDFLEGWGMTPSPHPLWSTTGRGVFYHLIIMFSFAYKYFHWKSSKTRTAYIYHLTTVMN